MFLTGEISLPTISFDLRTLEDLAFIKDYLLRHLDYLTSANMLRCSEAMMTLSNLLAVCRPVVNVVSSEGPPKRRRRL